MEQYLAQGQELCVIRQSRSKGMGATKGHAGLRLGGWLALRLCPAPSFTSCSLSSPSLSVVLQARMLYRGMSPQLVGGALETGVNYAVYQAMLKLTQVCCACCGLLCGCRASCCASLSLCYCHALSGKSTCHSSPAVVCRVPTCSCSDVECTSAHPSCNPSLLAVQGPDLQLPDAAAVPLSAASAGIVLSFVLSPAELVKASGCGVF